MKYGGLVTLLLVPLLGRAQNFAWLSTMIAELRDLVSLMVPVLMVLALALFLWGLVVFIFQADSDQARAAGRARMVWGVIALFVIVAVWGLVALLAELTGISQGTAIVAPSIIR